MSSLFWLILGITLILLEIIIPGFVIIFFGFSAIIISLLVYTGLVTNILYQFFYWSIISILLVFLLRKIVVKFVPSLEKNEYSKDTLVGMIASVIEEINPQSGTGKVKIAGTYWKAISMDGSIIEINRKVIVEKQDNLLLYVKLLE